MHIVWYGMFNIFTQGLISRSGYGCLIWVTHFASCLISVLILRSQNVRNNQIPHRIPPAASCTFTALP